jgi:phage pi2 protein 07
MKREITLLEQKEIEKRIVNDFIEYFSSDIDFTKIVYNDWTKKDVLAHSSATTIRNRGLLRET